VVDGGGLESLERLSASWNRISDVRFVGRLPRLRVLDLSHNAISRLPDGMFPRQVRSEDSNVEEFHKFTIFREMSLLPSQFRPSVRPSVCLSVCLFVCLSVCRDPRQVVPDINIQIAQYNALMPEDSSWRMLLS